MATIETVGNEELIFALFRSERVHQLCLLGLQPLSTQGRKASDSSKGWRGASYGPKKKWKINCFGGGPLTSSHFNFDESEGNFLRQTFFLKKNTFYG